MGVMGGRLDVRNVVKKQGCAVTSGDKGNDWVAAGSCVEAFRTPKVLMGRLSLLSLGSTPPRSAPLLLFASLTQTLVRVLFMLVRKLREEEMRERVRTRCVE